MDAPEHLPALDLPESFLGPLETIRSPMACAYLVALCSNGIVRDATKAAGVSYTSPWLWRQEYPAFPGLEATAKEIGADKLIKEAYHRAHEGLVREKFTKDGTPIMDPATGQQYVEGEYSDTLLMFLLKGALPKTYRENISLALPADPSYSARAQECFGGGVPLSYPDGP